jgi:deoxyribodipyrimidine photo-lyase
MVSMNIEIDGLLNLVEKNSSEALSFFDAIPKKWKITPEMKYPDPVVDLSEGRAAALDAYKNRKF